MQVRDMEGTNPVCLTLPSLLDWGEGTAQPLSQLPEIFFRSQCALASFLLLPMPLLFLKNFSAPDAFPGPAPWAPSTQTRLSLKPLLHNPPGFYRDKSLNWSTRLMAVVSSQVILSANTKDYKDRAGQLSTVSFPFFSSRDGVALGGWPCFPACLVQGG